MTRIILEVPKGQHYESSSLTYSGGFVSITQCHDCEAVQDYWSNNSRICEYCGGDLQEIGRGRWDNKTKKWQLRQTT